MSDHSKVICPNCVHEFTAIPVDVQERIAELEQEINGLNNHKTYIKWRGIEAGWDRELTPTELGDILAAAAPELRKQTDLLQRRIAELEGWEETK